LDRLFTIIEASNLPANLFLKHLAILADVGGEPLKQLGREFEMLFPEGTLSYYWRGTPYSYTFRALPHLKFNNRNLHIDGRLLIERYPLDDLKRDAIALLLFGSAYDGADLKVASVLSKCERGAQANTLGQLAQNFVAEYIRDNLGLDEIVIQSGGRLPGVSHTDPLTGRETSFDLVVTHGFRHVAIEVSFQVTTNSTIERKAGQARGRYEQIEQAGHKIAYVIDGAGNFQRETAMRTMLSHSHCSVAFSRGELDILCGFLREYFSVQGNHEEE
jgi:hypothetical protein